MVRMKNRICLFLFIITYFIPFGFVNESYSREICRPLFVLNLDNLQRFEGEMDKCKKGQIIRVFVDKEYVSPSTLSSGYCEYDKQIVVSDHIKKPGLFVLSCVYSGHRFY